MYILLKYEYNNVYIKCFKLHITVLIVFRVGRRCTEYFSFYATSLHVQIII